MKKQLHKALACFVYFLILSFSAEAVAQNVFSGEPVQVVGLMNGYSTGTAANSIYRRVSTNSGTPTDGRGQWTKTYNAQASGGDVLNSNMSGGGGNGFLFISGPSGNRFQNKWVFSGVGQGGLNSINTGLVYNTGNDMGLNMSTAGRYTFVFNDAGYTATNAKFYVGYTANDPVTVSRVSQNDIVSAATVSITTSATPSSGENVYLRYRVGTNDFSASTSVVQASGSGTSWTATLPAQTCGTTVYYYVYTSTRTLSQITADSESDRSLAVLRYDDSFGANYSFTFTTPSAPTGTLAITNSTCASACTVSGGSIAIGTVSGSGGTLQYSLNGGTTWSSTLPTYAAPQTIIASVISAGGCRSNTIAVGSTVAGVCTTPSAPTGTLAITNSTCASACTVSGGSIAIGTVSGSGGTLEYSTDNGGTWSSILPSYAAPQTIIASVINAGGCRSASTTVGTTVAGVCTTPSAPTGTLAITNSTCASACTVSGGSIAIGTVSGSGGTLQYSLNGGATWSATLPTYAAPQTIIASVINASGCRSTTTTVGSTVAGVCAPINANITNNNGLALTCAIPNTTLTASGGVSYSWSNGANTASTTVSSAGTYTVTVTGANGCTATTSVTTTLNNTLPTVTAANVSGCAGSPITLSGLPAGGSYSIANPYTGASTTYTYSYTDPANGCSATSSSATVTVQAAANAGSNGTLSICSTSTLTTAQLFSSLGGTPQAGGTWSPALAGAGIYTYTVNATSPCTTNATATVTVTVQAAPNAGSNGSLTICSGTTVTASQLFAQLTGTPSAGGTWTPALAGAGTYTYTVLATSPCSTNATAQVVVTAVSCQSAQLANCGNTPVLTSVNTRIFAANTVTTATKYRFRVAKSTAPTTYFYAETTYPSFRLTDVVGLTPTYGTTYNVDIQNEFLIGSQTVTSAYGQMCTVTTQAVTAVTVPTNQCGQTLAAINSKIYINGVTGATMYSYRIAKQSAPTVYSYIDTPYSNFRLTNAPTSGTVAIEHSTVYLVAVSVTTASGSSNYNGECQITTPDGPVTTLQASQCGDDDAPYVVATKSTKVYAADFVSGATYTFKLEQYDAQSNLVATKFANSPINYFDCNMFTGTNSLLPNTLYHVYVSINYYGQGPYDHDCVIKTPAALKQEEVTTQFSAVAYPNPFANNFMVDVKSSSQSVVNVKVYDMIGRMIDQRDVKMSDLETTTIGTNYPSGVYNVVVSQENSVETVRVIKR